MPIAITCGSCTAKLHAPEAVAGRTLKCPKCSTPIRVPGGSPAAPAAASKVANKPEAAVKATTKAAATDKASNKPMPVVKSAAKTAPAGKATEKAASVSTQPAKTKTSPPPAKAAAEAELAASDSWTTSPLLSEQKWMIRTKERIFFANFHPPRYDITRMGEKEILGLAVGRPGLFTKILWGFRGLRKFLTYKFEVHDGEEKQLLFTIRFPTPVFNFRARAEILDPDGNLLGSFTRKLFTLTVNYELRDPQEEKIGTFNFRMGDFREGQVPPRVALTFGEGSESGYVTGEKHLEAMDLVKQAKEGKAKVKVKVELLPPLPAMVIQIDPKAADRPETKILLLAGAIVLKAYGWDKMFK